MKLRGKFEKLFWNILIYIIIIVFLAPTAWMVYTSLKPEKAIHSVPIVWIPDRLTLSSYSLLFAPSTAVGSVPFPPYLVNSIIVSLSVTAITLILGTFAGYSFSRFRFPGKKGLFLATIVARAVPAISLSLPLFALYKFVGLIDTKIALIVAYSAFNVPFVVWFMLSFFDAIPRSIEEAAEVDGATFLQSFFYVDLPLVLPGIGAAGVFSFILTWSEYSIALTVTNSIASKTLTVGLFDFVQQFRINWGGMSAMGTLMLIPALIFTFLAQERLVEGLTFGAKK